MRAPTARNGLRFAWAVAAVGLLLIGCKRGAKTADADLAASESGQQTDKRNNEPSTEGDQPALSGGWRDILTQIGGRIMDAEYGVLFYAFDTLAYPEKPVDVAARLQSAKNLNYLEGATIGFYQGEELIGTAETDKDGYARISWTPPKAGQYEFTAQIVKPPEGDDYKDAVKVTASPLLVAARDKNAELAIVDLDYTVVGSSFLRVMIGGAEPMPGSVNGMNKLANRYTIVYLTHRPDILTRKSKTWLTDNGYPRGPLLVSELKDVFGDSGKFKTAKLKAIRDSFPNVRIGIGDKLSDAQAYVDNGMTAYLIPHYKNKPKDMVKTAAAIRELKGRGRLHVVSSWDEIDAAVFRRQAFPPEAFANRLEADAKRLQATEDRRKNSEDD